MRRGPPRFFQCTRPVYIVPRAFCGRMLRRPSRRPRQLPAFHYIDAAKDQISAIEGQAEAASQASLEELRRRFEPRGAGPRAPPATLTTEKLEQLLQAVALAFELNGREMHRMLNARPDALERLRRRLGAILGAPPWP